MINNKKIEESIILDFSIKKNNYGHKHTEETKKRLSESAKTFARPYQLKGKTYEEIYGKEKAEEQRLKRSLGLKKRHESGIHDKKFGFPKDGTMKIRRAKQIIPIRDTYIELKIQNFLMKLNIEFFTHQYVSEITHAYQCDISIPVQKGIPQKIIIECDGDWWHGNPIKYPSPNDMQIEQIKEDKIRTKELINKGFRVIRLWESDINRLNLNQLECIIRRK